MTPELQDLGRRAVVASQGRILSALGARLWSESEGGYWRVYMGRSPLGGSFKVHATGEAGGTLRMAKLGPDCGMLPDLSDPATRGCLLALVREAWGPVIVRPPEDAPTVNGWWEVEQCAAGGAAGGMSEAEALVAALEAAGA